jgi:Family of unknown function (DUF6159)
MSGVSTTAPEASGEGRIARSWRLSRAAWSVVRSDRALLTLAIISGLLGAAAIALIFGLSDAFGDGHDSGGRLALIALVLGYPLTFVSVFFNTAIAAAAAAALDGRRLSLGEALAVPTRRIGQVALWALMAAVVGVVLEQLASRLPLLGSIVVRLLGVGWSLASLFAIPILAIDDCSAPQSLRRSAQLVKERWGEGVGGNVIVTAWMILVIFPLVLVLGVALIATGSEPGARDTVIAIAAVVFIAVIAVGAVVRQTFAVALYQYAKTNTAQGPFQEHDLGSPFASKRRMFS